MKDRAAFACVLAGWFGLALWAWLYIACYAPRMPVYDDLELVPVIVPGGTITLPYLWSLHNEHRLPLPHLVQIGLYRLSGDFRSGMWAQVALLALIALALILLARRLRGRTSFADLFFPLVWLHTGNAENLLMGFQIGLVLPTAFAGSIAWLALAGRATANAACALFAALSLVALPLCGGPGLTQAPVLALWCAWLGWRHRTSPAGRVLLGGVLVCAAVCVLYMVGFVQPHESNYAASPSELLPVFGALLTLAIGPAGEAWWPYSLVLMLAALALAVLLLFSKNARMSGERERRLGLGAWLAATLCLALSITYGRATGGFVAGFANRYVSLFPPLLCATYFAVLLYGGERMRRAVTGCLCVVLLAALPVNAAVGRRWGENRRAHAAEIDSKIARGISARRLVRSYSEAFYGYERRCGEMLLRLAKNRMPPFEHASQATVRGLEFPMFFELPSLVRSEPAPSPRRIGEVQVLLVAADSELDFPLVDERRGVRGRMAIPPELVSAGKAGAIRFTVELRASDASSHTLFERTLDPLRVEGDRGLQAFDIPLAPKTRGTIVLRTAHAAADASDPGWGCWWDIELVEPAAPAVH